MRQLLLDTQFGIEEQRLREAQHRVGLLCVGRVRQVVAVERTPGHAGHSAMARNAVRMNPSHSRTSATCHLRDIGQRVNACVR
jgi:hypothetical protein